MTKRLRSLDPQIASKESTSSQPAADDDAKLDAIDATGPVTTKPEVTRNKKQLTFRIDRELLEWFKSQSPGYQTRMNVVLRHYAEQERADAGKKQP